MSEVADGFKFVRALVGAWDCCATCAGGVLLRRERELKAHAWDEGWRAAWSPLSMHSLDDAPNPYAAATPAHPARESAADGDSNE